MEETERTQKLKRAFAEGIIDIEEFETEITKELRQTARCNEYLNTADSLQQQIWLSEDISDSPDPAEVESVDGEMHLTNKPTGGMWTSTYTPDQEHDCDWIQWCSGAGFYSGDHKWLLEPKEDLDVLVIDSLKDLKTVASVYTKDTYKGSPASKIPKTVFDFETMAEDFDAIRLTKEGQYETRLTGSEDPDFYGWDSESVLNFRWNWSDAEHLGTVSYEN